MWTNCYGQHDTSGFAGALENTMGIGFTFGGKNFFGQGVYLTSGSATFKVNSYNRALRSAPRAYSQRPLRSIRAAAQAAKKRFLASRAVPSKKRCYLQPLSHPDRSLTGASSDWLSGARTPLTASLGETT